MGWLSGWNYRKSVTLSRASGAVSNYQMKLLVGESAGATGEDVDCGAHVLPSFNDLRFTKADGTTLLNYWIESITGTTPNQLATVWIEFDDIQTGATTFYMYYGKDGAAAASDGDATFIFFDHFTGIFPGTKWTGDTSYGSVADSILTLQGPSTPAFKEIFSNPNADQATFALRTNAKITSGEVYSTIGARKSDASHSSLIYNDLNTKELYSKDGATGSTVASNFTFDAYKIWDILINANTNMKIYENGVELTGSPKTTNPSNSASMAVEIGCNTTLPVLVDWILIRNWNSTEPVWGSWGSEEMPPSPLLSDLNPSLGQTGVEIDEPISFILESQGDGVDIDTVTVQIGSQVYQKGDPEFSYVGDENSYEITVTHPDFGYEETVSLEINASSLSGGAMEELDSNFTTSVEPRAPLLTGLVPSPGQTLVDINRPISFRLTAQGGDNVDLASITVQIGSDIYQDGDPEFSHTGDSGEYTIVVTHPNWSLEEVVNVKINASSLLAEPMDEKEYSFTVKWDPVLTRKGNARLELYEPAKYNLPILTIQENWVRQGIARYTADLELWYARYMNLPKADDVRLIVIAGDSVRLGSEAIANGYFGVRIGGSGAYTPMYESTILHLGGMYANTKKLIGLELLVPEDALTKGYVMFELQSDCRFARLWGQYPWGRGIYSSSWGIVDFHPNRIYYRAYVFDAAMWNQLQTGIAAYPTYRGEDKQW